MATLPTDTSLILEFPAPHDWMPRSGQIDDLVYEIVEAANFLALMTSVPERRSIWDGIEFLQHAMDNEDVDNQYRGMARIHRVATLMAQGDTRQCMRPLWRGLLLDIRVLIQECQGKGSSVD